MTTPSGDHRPRKSDDFGVYDDAKTYYAEDRHHNRYGTRTRTYSQVNLVQWLIRGMNLTQCIE